MPRATVLKARLAFVRRDFDEVLGRIDQTMLDWAPAEGMRTIGGQLVEVLITEMQIVANLREGKRISDDEAKAMVGNYDDLAHLRHSLKAVREDTLAYLDSFSEAELAEEISFDGGWMASLGLPTIPRAEIFINIAGHEWYHTGQLTSYLWARGDHPYDW